MSSPLYLCYDLKGIQSFIFAVPRLRYICGGSALIDRFDRETAAQLSVPKTQFLFAGGGKGAFVCDNEAAANQLQSALVRAAHQDGIGICFGCDHDYSEAAHVADRSFPYLPPESDMDGRPCQESGLYPVLGKGVHPMINKRVFQKGDRLDRHFERELQLDEKLRFFHDVAADSSEEGCCAAAALGSRNRWAIIVMDGNDMGAQHRIAAEHPDTLLKWLKLMSPALDDCCRESCHRAIKYVLTKWLGDKDNSHEVKDATMPDGTIIVPLRPLLVGGDDIVILCHVHYAFDFVRTVSDAFTELSAQKAEEVRAQHHIELWPATGGSLTVTAGVLFAPVSLPLASAISYTELLLASAKSKGRNKTNGKPAPPCIDWESVTEGLIDTPHARRQRELIFEDADINARVALTRRPYTLDEFSQLFELRNRYKDIPSTIRHQVLPGLRAGFWDRKVFVARLGKHQQVLIDDLDETEKQAKGRWKETTEKDNKKCRSTDVVDALLLMEEDSRMSWITT